MKKRLLACLLALCFLLSLTACGAKTPETRGNCFTVGYAAEAVSVDPDRIRDYYVAGYNNNVSSIGVLDDQQVKAVVIDDNSGAGPVVLISVDCVALSSADVGRIRDSLSDFTRETGCRAIHVISTHDHAGADTLGLWGPVGVDGKDDEFMETLREKTAVCVREAYENRTDGDLLFGSVNTDEKERYQTIQEDTRDPQVYDPNLYSFRFVPYDETRRPVRLINYATHAESLDGTNNLISADFPAYVAQLLDEAEETDMVWFPGAIGGLLRTRFIRNIRRENCYATAERIAEKILSIDNEVKLDPVILTDTQSFSVPCENPLFIAMKFLGVLEQQSHVEGGTVWLDTELGWLSVGGKQILLVPGELFPELAYGDSTGFEPAYPERALDTLCSVFGDDLLIFGLANDEIGYIVDPTNFVLSESKPYIDKTVDSHGENHYEETNSAGPETAAYLLEAARALHDRQISEE